ncbi:MAG: hypothetical protein N2260_05655 [Syntrophobacterales bacterium]|nr:hypothetical protein [Syntrophobacterales bacterium]
MKERTSLILRFCFIFGSAFLCLWVWSSAYFYMKISLLDPAYALEATVAFGMSLFVWILGLSIIAVVLFYELLIRYIEQKERAYRFKETISQVLSHRFGNFLVTQKINLSILEERFSKEVLKRARRSLTEIESQFKEVINIIEKFRPEHLERKTLMLKDLVLSVLKDYPKEEIRNRIRLSLHKSQVFVNQEEAKVFIQLFLENAIRYSDKIVYVRAGVFRRAPYLVVINDISKNVSAHGAGMGLIIAKNIAASLNVSFTAVSRGNLYFVITLWPKKRWFE